MKRISDLVERLDEEIEDAKYYAEEYIDARVKGSGWSQKWKEASSDELKHATNLHQKIVEEIEELKRVYTPPREMVELWEKEHSLYVEKTAWIRQMLSM